MNHVVIIRVNPNHSDPENLWAVFTDPGSSVPWRAYPSDDCLTNSEVRDWLEHTVAVPVPERRFKPGDLIEVKTSYHPFRAVRMDDYWWAPFDEYCLGKDSFLDGKEYTYIGNTLEMSR